MPASLNGSLVLLALTLPLVAAAPRPTTPPPSPRAAPPRRPATTRPAAPATAPVRVAATQPQKPDAPDEPPLLIPSDPADALAAAREARAEHPADAYRIYKSIVKKSPLSDEGKAAANDLA